MCTTVRRWLSWSLMPQSLTQSPGFNLNGLGEVLDGLLEFPAQCSCCASCHQCCQLFRRVGQDAVKHLLRLFYLTTVDLQDIEGTSAVSTEQGKKPLKHVRTQQHQGDLLGLLLLGQDTVYNKLQHMLLGHRCVRN